jgi:hypothetical protein
MERQDWWKGRRREYVIPYILFRQPPFSLEIGTGCDWERGWLKYLGINNIFVFAKVFDEERIPRFLSIVKPLQILDVCPLLPLRQL